MYYIFCSNCGGRLDVDNDYTGSKVECWHCGTKFVVEATYCQDQYMSNQVQAAQSVNYSAQANQQSSYNSFNTTGAVGGVPLPQNQFGSTNNRQYNSNARLNRRSMNQARRTRNRNIQNYAPAKRSNGGFFITLMLLMVVCGAGYHFYSKNKAEQSSLAKYNKKIQIEFSPESKVPQSSQIVKKSVKKLSSSKKKIRSSNVKSHNIRKAVAKKIVPKVDLSNIQSASQDSEYLDYTVTVTPSKTISKRNRLRLLGTNLAAWYERDFKSDSPKKLLDTWKPGMVRMPGGSWSDMLYWNGNGVKTFNRKTGMWKVDYSKFSPGFIIQAGKGKDTREKRRDVDVRLLHDFIDKLRDYADPLVTVNFGTGNAKMASEWVRWANKVKRYKVRYWQVGNEMDGPWEAGHYLWGTNKKKEVDAEYYAKKYERYVDAMKKVDRSILVGAQIPQIWVAPLIKSCPSKVDFVDHHYYFKDRTRVNDGIRGSFVDVDRRLVNDVKKDREIIKKYSKGHKVEIGVTEWNVFGKTGAETTDMYAALLSCYAVGKMMEVGVDFATQWDLFTSQAATAGGHGLAIFNENECVTKSQYWAFWVWSHYMSNKMVSTEVDGGVKLYSFTTASTDGKLYVMLINIAQYKSVLANINLNGGSYGKISRSVLLSRGSYFWEPNTMKIMWNRKPYISYQSISSKFKTVVPPYSIKVLEIAKKGSAAASEISRAAATWRPKKVKKLKLFVPDNAPSAVSYNGSVALMDSKGKPVIPLPSSPVRLTVKGPAEINYPNVSVDGGVGTFKIIPEKGASGKLKIKAEYNGITTSKVMHIRAAEYIDVPLLSFDSDKDLNKLSPKSGAKLKINYAMIANQGVLEADVSKVPLPRSKRATSQFFAVNLKHLKIPKKITGVFFDVKLSPKFNQDDIKLVVRLDGVIIGEVMLKRNSRKFIHIKLSEEDLEKQQKIINPNFCVFMLSYPKKNYKGKIYIDKFGVIEKR